MAGDPNGNWSRFTMGSGRTVKLAAIGDAPSAILNCTDTWWQYH